MSSLAWKLLLSWVETIMWQDKWTYVSWDFSKQKRCLWFLVQDIHIAHYVVLHPVLTSIESYTSCSLFTSPNCSEVIQMEIACLGLWEQNEILLGSFHPAVCRPGKNLKVQRNCLHCNFLITFSKTQQLNLARALENIQARAHYVQTVLLPFKPTWKKEQRAEVSVLQTAQHSWLK